MDGTSLDESPRTAMEVFNDFKGRRIGLINALTTEVDKFYPQCDPARENLCLYGLPNETWEVNLPVEEVPPELPEPILGINFARDGMLVNDWLSLVAVHSDAWLMSVAFYFGARFGFDVHERMRLFEMINKLPTVFEVVSATSIQLKEEALQVKEERQVKDEYGTPKSKSSGGTPHPRQAEFQPKPVKVLKEEVDKVEKEEGEDDQGATLCGACMENYAQGEFWICCDICEKWFHGKCVKITPAKAEHIKQYKCPGCNHKRMRG